MQGALPSAPPRSSEPAAIDNDTDIDASAEAQYPPPLYDRNSAAAHERLTAQRRAGATEAHPSDVDPWGVEDSNVASSGPDDVASESTSVGTSGPQPHYHGKAPHGDVRMIHGTEKEGECDIIPKIKHILL